MELTREHACGTAFLFKATVTTKEGEQMPYPAQLHLMHCGEICHATSRAGTGSCLNKREILELAIAASESVIAQQGIDPNAVEKVIISSEEISMNICERQNSA